ncbi:MAG: TetR family transcriptional regulator [Anaerolineales bacterium]|nr:TetR family transcriptional regulator [Anaerolineales bacterium]
MTNRRQRDKDQTIQDVLTAATQLFSQNGLHGTSIRDIEEASGVSKGLIMHHFETKENLYAAVQDHLNQKYINWMASQRDASENLRAAIETGIRSSLDYLQSNQEFRRIALWSYLEGQEKTTELDKRFTVSLIEAMRLGQETGLVRDDVKAFVLPFIIRGAIDNWIRREFLRGELFGEIQGEVDITDDQLVDTLVKLMLA